MSDHHEETHAYARLPGEDPLPFAEIASTSSNDRFQINLRVDPDQLQWLIVQTAASVVDQLSVSAPVSAREPLYGPGRQLAAAAKEDNPESDYSIQAFLALETQVRFLFLFVRHEADLEKMMFAKGPMCIPFHRRLVAKALEAFARYERDLDKLASSFGPGSKYSLIETEGGPLIYIPEFVPVTPWTRFNTAFLAIRPRS